MAWSVAVLTLTLALSQAVAAQQTYFSTASDCTARCIQGTCSAFQESAYGCVCKAGYTGSACDHLQGSGSSAAPVQAPAGAGEAPLLAPTPATAALLDCGVGAHALYDNGTAYCNCDGTGTTGVNCEIPVATPTPAPAPGPAAAVAANTPASGPYFAPAMGPSLAAMGVPPVSSASTGSCPQGSFGCTVCSDGVYCLNGGRCASSLAGGCECVAVGSLLYGGPNCQTPAGTISNNSPSAGQTTTSSSNPVQKTDPTGHHVSGVGVAIIVIVVLAVVAGIVAAFAFYKARGRTSKFDRFADQPEIFRGAVTNL
ncbi:hypothetical protein WJX74_001357 [Apatococcus lobatus]|uniref:EGF-like domain-containing protein n=1 Tax=Apatococcus lobatus TaxID=904363 RepID=A0AAW1Q5A9_9CHLO